MRRERVGHVSFLPFGELSASDSRFSNHRLGKTSQLHELGNGVNTTCHQKLVNRKTAFSLLSKTLFPGVKIPSTLPPKPYLSFPKKPQPQTPNNPPLQPPPAIGHPSSHTPNSKISTNRDISMQKYNRDHNTYSRLRLSISKNGIVQDIQPYTVNIKHGDC